MEFRAGAVQSTSPSASSETRRKYHAQGPFFSQTILRLRTPTTTKKLSAPAFPCQATAAFVRESS
eukprot:CAMPEP_0185852212 /NCGR_PEP_ID=MMETSP1354-20130828/13751_1 /TAXON_ID=708628 /ORGANISM="Erythrolobus madagascarensis, Strain CCMP3276" /LENGTH=64 /DNA_ID=CAMNT_0028553401 /DNA_START=42 /DNA_END=236 /DNA_ORIENTATION=+